MCVRIKNLIYKYKNAQYTDCPGESLVLGDVCNVERLHGVFDILGVHVVDLTDVTLSEKKQQQKKNTHKK